MSNIFKEKKKAPSADKIVEKKVEEDHDNDDNDDVHECDSHDESESDEDIVNTPGMKKHSIKGGNDKEHKEKEHKEKEPKEIEPKKTPSDESVSESESSESSESSSESESSSDESSSGESSSDEASSGEDTPEMKVNPALLIGIHVGKTSVINGKKFNSLAIAVKDCMKRYKLNVAQIFTHGPRIIKPNAIGANDLKKLQPMIYYDHTPYPFTGIWNIKESKKGPYYTKMLTSMLEANRSINSRGIVIHISQKPAQLIADIMNTVIKPIASKYGVPILLEMVAQKANENTYETPEKLNHLANLIGVADWWGFVIDTAHVWCAGVNIRTKASVDSWLAGIQHKQTIKLIHFNGAAAKLGSGKDKHIIPFSTEDEIWSNYLEETRNLIDISVAKKSGFYSMIKFALSMNIPIVFEINRGTEREFKTLLDICHNI